MSHADELAKMPTEQLLDELRAIQPQSPPGGDHDLTLRRSMVLIEATTRLAATVVDRDTARRLTPSATTTVEHVKLWLKAHMGKGVDCPACGRVVKMYPRHIGPSMASALLALYRAHGTDFANVTSVWDRLQYADAPKLRYWDLLEPHRTDRDGARPDGERAVFRVTDKGVAFIMGRVTVPNTALTFDTRCFGLEGDPISFVQALRSDAFDLAALMAERPWDPPTDDPPTLFS